MFQALELPQATFYSRFSTTDQHTEHSGQNNIQSLPMIFIAKLPFDRSLWVAALARGVYPPQDLGASLLLPSSHPLPSLPLEVGPLKSS